MIQLFTVNKWSRIEKILESGEVTNAGYPVVAIGKVDKVWVGNWSSDQHINSLKKGQKVKCLWIWNKQVYGRNNR